MSKETDKKVAFVSYLETLKEDRAALAALRRGLGQPPGSATDMYPYVIPRLPSPCDPWYEEACYTVAALYALHPETTEYGNMGSHFAAAKDPDGDNTALERRFRLLLAAHRDDLPFHLRQAVSFLRSKDTRTNAKGISINWHQLFIDLMGWRHSERYVQKQWATSFWRGIQASSSDQTSNA